MREPSIHITETQLRSILFKVLGFDSPQGEECIDHLDEYVEDIMKLGAKNPVTSRSINISNDRIENKAKKLLASNKNDANLFANTLQLVRRQLKHRGVRQIKPNTRDWFTIKELTGIALDFCNEFSLDRKEGFAKFIQIGISKMKKFQMNKLLNMYDGIAEHYRGIQEMEDDPHKALTKSVHDIYCRTVGSKTGINANYDDDPANYLYFIEVSKILHKLNVNGATYIKSQFHGFEWRNGIPQPIQLTGKKAIERFNNFLYENNLSLKTKQIQLKT